MTDQWREVRLPSKLCAAAEQMFAARFGNVEELLSFVLRELLQSDVGQLDQAEQDLIEKRLKGLGYL
jgi:hypothetical protein